MGVDDFKRHYWLKEELMVFCKSHGLRGNSSKEELTIRIVEFLSGQGPDNVTTPRRHGRKGILDEPLSLDTLITENYTNSQTNRAFFQSVIGPRFRFTTRFMNFCKNNVGKTYGDAINEWLLEREERKRGDYRPEIGRQFEYNRFIREYFQSYPGKSMKEAVDAWWRWRGGDPNDRS